MRPSSLSGGVGKASRGRSPGSRPDPSRASASSSPEVGDVRTIDCVMKGAVGARRFLGSAIGSPGALYPELPSLALRRRPAPTGRRSRKGPGNRSRRTRGCPLRKQGQQDRVPRGLLRDGFSDHRIACFGAFSGDSDVPGRAPGAPEALRSSKRHRERKRSPSLGRTRITSVPRPFLASAPSSRSRSSPRQATSDGSATIVSSSSSAVSTSPRSSPASFAATRNSRSVATGASATPSGWRQPSRSGCARTASAPSTRATSRPIRQTRILSARHTPR